MAEKVSINSFGVTDQFWARVEPLIPQRNNARASNKPYQRKPGAGRPQNSSRQVFEAIVYVLRTGCQWQSLPQNICGSATTVNKRFLEWEKAGFFELLWKTGLAQCEDMAGIEWCWLAPNGKLRAAPRAPQTVFSDVSFEADYDFDDNFEPEPTITTGIWANVNFARSR
jgi:transposase